MDVSEVRPWFVFGQSSKQRGSAPVRGEAFCFTTVFVQPKTQLLQLTSVAQQVDKWSVAADKAPLKPSSSTKQEV